MAPTLSLVTAATPKAAALACPHRRPAASSLAKRSSLTLRTHAAQPGGEQQPGEELPSSSSLVEQLMNDPENQARMQRVTEAAQRVAELQAESQRLAAAMAEAEASEAATAEQRERRAQEAASQLIAEAEVAAKQKLLQAAQLEAEAAAAAQRKWAADINEDAERLESAKAAAAAAAGGAAATLPLVLSGGAGAGAALLSLAAAGVASALLGVTYRYAVRQDLGNTQLKAGVVAAFGLVRGLGEASATLAPSASSSGDLVAGLELSIQALGSAGLALGQCMLAAAFAATAVELGMQQGLVKPFGAAGGDGAAGDGNQ